MLIHVVGTSLSDCGVYSMFYRSVVNRVDGSLYLSVSSLAVFGA